MSGNAISLAPQGVSAQEILLPLNLIGATTNPTPVTAVLNVTNSSALGASAIWGKSNGNAVSGESVNQAGVAGRGRIGTRGDSTVANGVGVSGFSTGDAATGVEGRITGTSGTAVAGIASAGGESAKFVGGSGGMGNCTYAGGAGWNCTSDRNKKENFRSIDSSQILESVAAMPVSQWNMKGDTKHSPHIGPTAQDFYAAFKLGDSDVTINTADAQGVALAAIKGLVEENRALKTQLKGLEERLTKLEQPR